MTRWPRLLAAAYAPLGWRRAQGILDVVCPHLPVLPGRLLDLGAGTGHTAALLAGAGWDVTMADVPPHPGALGQRLVAHPIAEHLGRQLGVPRLLYGGVRLPGALGGFDAVLLAFVLHHCADPAAVVKEAARVCVTEPRPGRVLVLEDEGGNASAPGGLEHLADALINLEFGHPHGERSRHAWLQLFRAAGLTVTKEQPFTSRFGGLTRQHRLYVLNFTSPPMDVRTGSGATV